MRIVCILLVLLWSAAVGATTLTVYQDGRAQVRIPQQVRLQAGRQDIDSGALPQSVDAHSLHLALSAADCGARVEAMVFDPGIAPRDLSIDAWCGRQVVITLENRDVVRGRLLGRRDGYLFLEGGRALNRDVVAQVSRDNAGQAVSVLPHATWSLHSDAAGLCDAVLSYTMRGISWQPAYRAVYAGAQLHLQTTAIVENQTGMDWAAETVNLVAGSPGRSQPAARRERTAARLLATADAVPAHDRVLEYHRYQLSDPLQIADGTQVQVPLLLPLTLAVEARYVYDVRVDPRSLMLQLHGRNRTAHPLPAGTVRFFRQTADAEMLYVGEDAFAATPAQADFRLQVGQAFDLRAERTVSEVREPSRRTREESVRVVVQSGKLIPVDVRVVEPVRGAYRIDRSNYPVAEQDATAVTFVVPVAANSRVTLEYTVIYQY